jgi:D-alanine-D-alanine ligase
MRRGRKVRKPKRLDYPLFVKSLTQEASIGISQASVVDDDTKLVERVQFIHESIGTDAIVERYIKGRELYCGVLGNDRLKVLPVFELTFDNMPDGQHKIATERVKWNSKYQDKVGVMTGLAEDLSDEQIKRIQHITRRTYRVLEMNGYGRIDLRVDADGQIYVLEANPNPQIAQYEDFARSADCADIPYHDLIQRILKMGLQWEPERKG